MLKAALRLRRNAYGNLLDSRRFFHTEHFMLRAAESPLGPRIGVTVSKKVSKSAVDRNRIRRRTYAALEGLTATLPPGLYLVVAKSSAGKVQGQALKIELAELLKKV